MRSASTSKELAAACPCLSTQLALNLVQALWALASLSKSKVESRKQAASGILKTARKHQDIDKQHRDLYSQFPAFCDQLIRLCHHNPGDKAK